MIQLFVVGFFGAIVGVVLVRRIARPAAGIGVQLADQQALDPAILVLAQDMLDAVARMGFERTEIDLVHLIGGDAKRAKPP